MAIPIRAWGYQFKPQPGATVDEMMEILAVVMRLVTNNNTLAIGPRKEVEDLPENLRRHFRKQNT